MGDIVGGDNAPSAPARSDGTFKLDPGGPVRLNNDTWTLSLIQQAATLPQAVSELKDALGRLDGTPTGQRTTRYHELLASLGAPLVMSLGYPSEEVRELYLQIAASQDSAYKVTAARGLWVNAYTRGALLEALQIAQRLVLSARDDSRAQVEGLMALAWSYAGLGLWEAAKLTSDRLIAICPTVLDLAPSEPLTDHPLILGLDCRALAFVQLGFPERAVADAQRGVAVGEEIEHPFSIAVALLHLGACHLWLHNRAAGRPPMEQALALCTEHGFDYWGIVARLSLHAMVEGDRAAQETAVAGMETELAALQATGCKTGVAMFHCLLAERYQALGRLEEARATIDRGLAIIAETSESSYRSELHRVKGELLMAAGDIAGAVGEINTAIRWCQDRGLKLFELRAALSMADLLDQRGQAANLRPQIESLHGWFTEGHHTPDLRRATSWIIAVPLRGQSVA